MYNYLNKGRDNRENEINNIFNNYNKFKVVIKVAFRMINKVY